jgi:glutamate racemase
VEPGALAAARISRTGRIGVIGTQGTILSGAYQEAIRLARPEAVVIAQPCPLFVPLAEEGWTDPDDEIVRAIVRRYLAPLGAAGIDALVLGCTHYPLLKAAIARELPGIVLVDSAEAIAADVRARLGGGSGPGSAGEGTHRFFVTDLPERFTPIAGRFLGRPVERAEHVDV